MNLDDCVSRLRRLLVLTVATAACGTSGKADPAEHPGLAMPPDVAVAHDASTRVHPGSGDDKHMTFSDDPDAGSVPVNHADLLWGDFIDKQGRPAVGWHSHDPVTGNAQ